MSTDGPEVVQVVDMAGAEGVHAMDDITVKAEAGDGGEAFPLTTPR